MELTHNPTTENIRFSIEGKVGEINIGHANLSNDLYLDIFVNEDYRSLGFGKQLFQQVIDYIDSQSDITHIYCRPGKDKKTNEIFLRFGFKPDVGRLIRSVSFGQLLFRNLTNPAIIECMTTHPDIKFYTSLLTCGAGNTADQIRRIQEKINHAAGDLFHRKNVTRAFVLNHLGLGDNIGSIGLVRHLSTLYDTVTVVCLNKNKKNMEEFYKDDPSINLYTCETWNDISKSRGCPPHIFDNITKGYDAVITTGEHDPRGVKIDKDNFPLCFYSNIGFDESLYWTHFHVPESNEAVQLYDEFLCDLKLLNVTNYCVITSRTSDGDVCWPCHILHRMNIDKETILVLNLDGPSVYEQPHRFALFAEKYSKAKLYKLPYILKHANKVILTDSSIFCLAIHLELQAEEFYNIYRGYNHTKLFNKKPSSGTKAKQLKL